MEKVKAVYEMQLRIGAKKKVVVGKMVAIFMSTCGYD